MAHLPCHLVFMAIVMFISQLFSKVDCQAEHLFVFNVRVRERNRPIMVSENGTIFSSTRPPSLHSIIKMDFSYGTNTPRGSNHSFSLQAIATKYYICMNKNGKLYTTMRRSRKKREEHKKKRGSLERNRRKNERRHGKRKRRKGHRRRRKNSTSSNAINVDEPDECLFRMFQLDQHFAHFKDAIYSAAYSNFPLEGRFMAFKRDGHPRNLKMSFHNVTHCARQGMMINRHELEKMNMRNLLKYTTFGRNGTMNSDIRTCIQTSDIMSNNTLKTHPKNFTRVIHRCRRMHSSSRKRKRTAETELPLIRR